MCTTPPQAVAVQPMRPAAVSAARSAPIRYAPAPPTPSTCGWLCPAVASGPRVEAGAVPPDTGAADAGPAPISGTSVPSASAAVVRRIEGRFIVRSFGDGSLPC